MIAYYVCDGVWDDEIFAEDDAAAMKAAKAWLVDLIGEYESVAGWDDLKEGEESEMIAGVTRVDSDIDDVTGETTIKVRRVGGRIAVVD